MNMKPKQLIHALADLDKKAEGLDEILKSVRVEINNVLWDLMEAGENKKLHTNHKK